MTPATATNALIHLIAMAGRVGVELTLDDFDVISRRVPWLANIRPSGDVPDGGLLALFSEHITQANQGCDFGFLARRGRNPEPDPR